MFVSLRACMACLVCDEEGASLVEYVLLLVFVSIVAVAGTTFLGLVANNRVNNIWAVMQ